MSLRRLMDMIFRRTLRDETGAVTVDWVVLTAVVVGLAGSLMLILQDPISNGGKIVAEKIAASN